MHVNLNLLVDYFNVQTCDIYTRGTCHNEEGESIEHVCFLGFWHRREGVTLQQLGCSPLLHIIEGFAHSPPPIGQHLDMRQEYRTFKSVASCPCEWLLLVLAMRARGGALTKTDGKIGE